MKRPRKPGRVIANPHEVAIEGARRLRREDTDNLRRIIDSAVEGFQRGQHCPTHWCALADALNVAESLADIGICSDDASRERITGAQAVLAAVHQRHAQGRGWTLYAAELRSLQEGAWLHGVQLDHCSLSEYDRAVTRTRERVRQAKAGNAAAGVTVLEGALA